MAGRKRVFPFPHASRQPGNLEAITPSACTQSHGACRTSARLRLSEHSCRIVAHCFLLEPFTISYSLASRTKASDITVPQGTLLTLLQLANGLSMPTIHLGVYLTSGTETYQAVRWALEVCLPNPNRCQQSPCGMCSLTSGWLSGVGLSEWTDYCKLIDDKLKQNRLRPDVPQREGKRESYP